jgi:CRP/FNR family transcriptional regulator, cyclic AMP receptor protein
MLSSRDRSHRLADVPLFASLAPGELEQVAAVSRLRRYPAGQILCSEGDPGEALYVLEEGVVRVSRFGPSGQETVLAVVEAPAALGELSLLDGAPRDATITAQEAVSVRLVPRAALLTLLQANPRLIEGLLKTLADWIRRSNTRQAELLGLDVPGRLAKWLLDRAQRSGITAPGGIAIRTGRTQAELAAELGTTRSTLNRALKDYEEFSKLTGKTS